TKNTKDTDKEAWKYVRKNKKVKPGYKKKMEKEHDRIKKNINKRKKKTHEEEGKKIVKNRFTCFNEWQKDAFRFKRGCSCIRKQYIHDIYRGSPEHTS